MGDPAVGYGPHHPWCLTRPASMFGPGCACKGVVVQEPDLAVVTDVTYHGDTPETRWTSQRPVVTTPYVTARPQFRRLGG